MSGLTGPRIIAAGKVRDYLLNPFHVDGASKAQFFARFGFSRGQAMLLSMALHRHAVERDVVKEQQGQYGVKRMVRCNLSTPDGRDPCILAVWIQPIGSDTHSFVTAYPAH